MKPLVLAHMQDTGPEYAQSWKFCSICWFLPSPIISATLEEVNKSLEDYLQLKRIAFPRFFFLSNDELLEILAQAREPRAVQPHLRKCFDAIASLDFGDEDDADDRVAEEGKSSTTDLEQGEMHDDGHDDLFAFAENTSKADAAEEMANLMDSNMDEETYEKM